MKRHRFLVSFLLFILCTFLLCAVSAFAAETDTVLTDTLNIAQANKNEVGPGYNWKNRYDILELDGLHLETERDFGLRLPKNCTVILSGTNYIKAAKYALSCLGTVTFKGSGTLILDAGETGIFLYSDDGTQKIRLLEGDYQIHAGKYGIYSTAPDFSLIDGTLSITVDDENGAAISGRIVNLLGGTFNANSSVESTHIMNIKGVNLHIASAKPAFSSKTLTVSDIALSANGAAISSYTNESDLEGVSTLKRGRTSLLFGEEVSAGWDYVCLVVLLAAIASAVVIPILRHKKKAKALLARLETENPDAAAALRR